MGWFERPRQSQQVEAEDVASEEVVSEVTLRNNEIFKLVKTTSLLSEKGLDLLRKYPALFEWKKLKGLPISEQNSMIETFLTELKKDKSLLNEYFTIQLGMMNDSQNRESGLRVLVDRGYASDEAQAAVIVKYFSE